MECDCGGTVQEREWPTGTLGGPTDALLYPEALYHHLTPVIVRRKVNGVGTKK